MPRLFTQFVTTACQEIGINCEPLSDDWLIRMQGDKTVHLTLGYGFDINNAAADRVGNDKVAQYELLRKHSIPAIAHYLARTPSESSVNLARLGSLPHGAPYVTKPVDGSGGNNIQLHSSLDEAVEYINSLATIDQSWSLSPYEKLTYERRFIVLDDDILLSYDKSQPYTSDSGLTFFNLGQGARPTTIVPTAHELDIVRRAARACTLRLAAIDIVQTVDGKEKVMEINSGIMCEAYAQQSAGHYTEVQQVYRTIIRRIFEESSLSS